MKVVLLMATDETSSLRAALRALAPSPSHDAISPPSLQQIYTPPGHEAALDPERALVIGGRGMGKSFWSAALVNDETRLYIAKSYPRLQLAKCDVALGFAGVDSDANGAPSKDELDDLIETDKHDPQKVWRAVILKGICRHVDIDVPTDLRGQEGLVSWVAADAARVQRLFRAVDEELVKQGKRVVIVFDALDRLGRDWQQIRERTRALLQVALALRTYRAIKPKIFLRTDQAEDGGIANFPDASKLLSSGARVDLTWDHRDLFGLLYTLLLNDESAHGAFERLVSRATSITISRRAVATSLPAELKDSEDFQARIFIELAGRYMGANAQKGRTYTWLHKHLADAHGRVSPRTFLQAVRQAAEYRGQSDGLFAISPAGLRSGIQSASEVRVAQLREEYSWIDAVLEPLADQQVPCRAEQLYERWNDAGTVGRIAGSDGKYLEPIEFSEGNSERPVMILRALLRIGIAERRSDGRINIPDIYRVAAKMLRKGGIPPNR
jgi:hypothetical protein